MIEMIKTELMAQADK